MKRGQEWSGKCSSPPKYLCGAPREGDEVGAGYGEAGKRAMEQQANEGKSDVRGEKVPATVGRCFSPSLMQARYAIPGMRDVFDLSPLISTEFSSEVLEL